jgi:carboxymethylenebutenolidase
VLVLHAWWGLNQYFRDLCDCLAAEGFVAVAPDLYGNGAVATEIEQAEAQLQGADHAAFHARVEAALAALEAHPARRGDRVGALGFSMGAAWALELAAEQPDTIGAVVVYYGSQSADFSAARAAYLGHFGEDDPWEPDEGVAQMEAAMLAAGRRVEFHRYAGAGHWFAEHNRPDAYDAQAAQLAWERTVTFLHEQLG